VDIGRAEHQKGKLPVPRTKPNYSEQFKQEVLAYQASTGTSTKQTAEHFDVSANSIRDWRKRAKAPLGAPQPADANESPEAELRRLRRENHELHMRCEILKKTVTIFSNPSANDSTRYNT
tara:strand:+ start:119 stop:478 length:360 start_codon:yes stop_codon:yes gene_type:complete